jgi:hypothetical protein
LGGTVKFWLKIGGFFYLLSMLALASFPVDLLDKTSGLSVLSCGGAGTARAGGVGAAYWNPAALAFSGKSGFDLTYYQKLGFVNHSSLDAVLLLGGDIFPLGFNLVQEGINDIPRTSSAGGLPVEEGSFADECRFINFSTAFHLDHGLYGGLNYKIISRVIDKHHAEGFAVDLGLIQIMRQDLTLGASFRNIFSALDWSTGLQEYLARKLTAGAAYHLRLSDFENYLYADLDVYSEEERGWALGLESWLLENIFCLRGGVNSGGEFTLGTGLRYTDFHCDLALLFNPDKVEIDNSFLFGLGLDFQLPQNSAVQAAGAVDFQPEINVSRKRIVVSELQPEKIQEIAVLDPADNVLSLPVRKTIEIPAPATGDYTIFFQLKNEKIVKQIVTVE